MCYFSKYRCPYGSMALSNTFEKISMLLFIFTFCIQPDVVTSTTCLPTWKLLSKCLRCPSDKYDKVLKGKYGCILSIITSKLRVTGESFSEMNKILYLAESPNNVLCLKTNLPNMTLSIFLPTSVWWFLSWHIFVSSMDTVSVFLFGVMFSVWITAENLLFSSWVQFRSKISK